MLEQIKKMVADNLGVEESKITENASFKDDLGADSLDLFELTMALEDEYGIEIPSEDLEKIVTVGDSILFEEPVSIEKYKPFLYRTVRLIIQSHRK